MMQATGLKPQVNQIQPPGCVHRGDTITIQGINFGTGNGQTVSLYGGGVTIDLAVSSWGANSISAAIPDVPGIRNGQSFTLGIQPAGHGGWLSNTDKTIVICGISPVAPAPLRNVLPLGAGSSAGTTTSGDDTSSDNSNDSSGYDNSTTPAGAVPPTGGGSLLQSQLPPPPQNLPPPPRKEDKTIEPGEVIVVSSNMSEAQALATQAQTLGFGLKSRRILKGLGFVVTVLRAPSGNAAGNALASLRGAMPNVWADVNHRYELQGAETKDYGPRLLGWNGSPHCGGGMRIGLLDSTVDQDHPALRGRAITEQSFLAAGIRPAPPGHGTATAALLVANPQASGLSGLVPDAHLYIANIFRDRGHREIDTTAEWIVLALDWLASQRVSIVNMSLGGPRNLLVEAAVQRLQERGVAVVAAAGNGGEKGPPVYPAAQPGVVAVTAVDAKLNIYEHATHGDYIAFSAPGVDVWTAAPGRDGVYVSGTSYAVPFVTAALAQAHSANPKASWPALEHQLERAARDLGAPGKDAVFGWGLAQAAGCRASTGKRH
ncbi:MAG: S8 family serine peptidase [Bacteroidota bacterium]